MVSHPENKESISEQHQITDQSVRWPTSAHRIPESHTEFK